MAFNRSFRGSRLSVTRAAYRAGVEVVASVPLVRAAIPDVETDQGAAISLDLRQWFYGASPAITSIVAEGALPAGVTLDGFNASFDAVAAGEVTLQVRAVNAEGTSAVAAGVFRALDLALVSSVTMGGRVWTFSDPVQIVTHVDGPVAIVNPPAGFTVTPPASRLVGGRTLDGSMINATRGGNQGWDSYMRQFDAALVLSGPTPMPVNSIMTTVTSRDEAGNLDRKGVTHEQFALYACAVAPDPNSLAPEVINYAGRTSWAAGPVVDWDARAAAVPTYAVSNANNRPPWAAILPNLKFCFGFAMYSGASNGYEAAKPFEFGGPWQGYMSSNWGGYGVQAFNDTLAHMQEAGTPAAERKACLIFLASYGRQVYEPVKGAGEIVDLDGGHFQPEPLAGAVYLWATAQETEWQANFASVLIGNWAGAFRVDQSLLDELVPFGDPDDVDDDAVAERPWFTHRRRITDVEVDRFEIAFKTGNGNRYDQSKFVPTGLVAYEEGQGAGYLITDDDLPSTLTTGNHGPFWMTSAGHGLPLNGVGALRSEYPLTLGMIAWSLRRMDGVYRSAFNPSYAAQYRDDQRWGPAFRFIRSVGWMIDALADAAALVDACATADFPTAISDWPIMEQTNPISYDLAYAMHLEHGAAIAAIAQPWLTVTGGPDPIVPTTAPVLHSIVSDGVEDPFPMPDLWVVSVPDDAEGQYPVQVRIECPTDSLPQVRAMQGAVEVQGWTDVALSVADVAQATLDLPITVDLITLEIRYKGGTTVYADLRGFTLGTAIQPTGQSQIQGCFGARAAGFTLPAAAEGRGVIYRFQEGGYGPTDVGSIPETFEPITDASNDGPRAFVAQWVEFRPDRRVMLVPEAVSGTGALPLLDDQNDLREWDDVEDKRKRIGTDYSVILFSWNSSPSGERAQGDVVSRGQAFIERMMGLRTTGFNGETLEHSFADILPAWTKWAMMPATRHSTNHGDWNHSVDMQRFINSRPDLDWTIGVPCADYLTDDGPHAEPTEDGNVVMGYRLALTALRALGHMPYANPYFTEAAERSVDGQDLFVHPVLPNGGALGSRLPNNLSGFQVLNDTSGDLFEGAFTASIQGDDVRLRIGAGAWSETLSELAVTKSGPLDYLASADYSIAAEKLIRDGELYETGLEGILGDGLPVHGRMVNYSGVLKWEGVRANNGVELPWYPDTAAEIEFIMPTVTQLAAPPVTGPSDFTLAETGTGSSAQAQDVPLPANAEIGMRQIIVGAAASSAATLSVAGWGNLNPSEADIGAAISLTAFERVVADAAAAAEASASVALGRFDYFAGGAINVPAGSAITATETDSYSTSGTSHTMPAVAAVAGETVIRIVAIRAALRSTMAAADLNAFSKNIAVLATVDVAAADGTLPAVSYTTTESESVVALMVVRIAP